MTTSLLRLVLTLLLLSAPAYAATISGTTYNLNLDILENAVIELREPNTGQTQRIVSRDGTYRFTAGPGRYQLIATHSNLAAVDPLIIQAESDSTIIHDVILIDTIDDLEQLLNETEEQLVNEDDLYEPATLPYWIIGIALLMLIVGLLLYRYMRAPGKRRDVLDTEPGAADDELKQQVFSYIEQEQGRTTQKDIRRQFPVSEAKISLVLTELEHEGKIKKIKKGRTNVIIKNA